MVRPRSRTSSSGRTAHALSKFIPQRVFVSEAIEAGRGRGSRGCKHAQHTLSPAAGDISPSPIQDALAAPRQLLEVITAGAKPKGRGHLRVFTIESAVDRPRKRASPRWRHLPRKCGNIGLLHSSCCRAKHTGAGAAAFATVPAWPHASIAAADGERGSLPPRPPRRRARQPHDERERDQLMSDDLADRGVVERKGTIERKQKEG